MASSKANSDHLQLASVIRGVHRDLRRRYNNCVRSDEIAEVSNVDELWAEHCGRLDVLNEYASAMHRLASTHWVTNNRTTRIDWCYDTIRNCFLSDETSKESHRNILTTDREIAVRKTRKVRVLDVGSCYNPFAIYEDLDVLAIDLCPATEDVHKCDFLNLHVSTEPKTTPSFDFDDLVRSLPRRRSFVTNETLKTLPSGFFDVVVFSLFLEYFPSRRQRLKCCLVARDLLDDDDGLLIVATPDSKHLSRNASMVKSWKLGFETIGFRRILYEKQTHLHLMAFRKDFVEYEEPKPSIPSNRSRDEDADLVRGFTELPEA